LVCFSAGGRALSGFDPYHKWLGISPDHQPPNHYRLLALEPFEADPDVIAHAADQRMAHIRSFQTGENANLSQCILNEIASAKLCLLNPRKKWEYDQALSSRLAPPVQTRFVPLPPPLPQAPPPAPETISLIIDEPYHGSNAHRRKFQKKASLSWLPWLISCAGGLAALIIFLLISAQEKKDHTAQTAAAASKRIFQSPSNWKRDKTESASKQYAEPRAKEKKSLVKPTLTLVDTPENTTDPDLESSSDPDPESLSDDESTPRNPTPNTESNPENKASEKNEMLTRMSIAKDNPKLPGNFPNLKPRPPKYKPGLITELFNDTQFQRRIKTKIEDVVNFRCSSGQSPDIDINCYDYGIRWSGYLWVPVSGKHRFVMDSDDGIRMTLGGKCIISSLGRGGHFSALIYLKQGLNALLIEFLQGGGPSECHLQWSRPNDGDMVQAVSAEYFFHDIQGYRFEGYKESLAAVSEDTQMLLGTWEVTVGNRLPVLWTFRSDGSVTPDKNVPMGKWSISGNKIEILWHDSDRWDTFWRPLTEKGIIGHNWKGDMLRAKKTQ